MLITVQLTTGDWIINRGLFPREDYFTHPQDSLVAYSSLSRKVLGEICFQVTMSASAILVQALFRQTLC